MKTHILPLSAALLALALTMVSSPPSQEASGLIKRVGDLEKKNKDFEKARIGSIRTLAYKEADLPEGWLLCDGAQYPVGDYPILAERLEGLWRKPDTGTKQFRVPDLRGVFLRGADRGSKNDPDANSRLGYFKHGNAQGDTTEGVGSVQSDRARPDWSWHHKPEDLKGKALHFGPAKNFLARRGIKIKGTETYVGGVYSLSLKAGGDEFDWVEPQLAQQTAPKNVAVDFIIYAGRPSKVKGK